MATKSGQEPEKSEVIEELLDGLDTSVDRVKVLYEQYFLGIQKQPPTYLHTDIERKIRELAQLQIRNTALRYRFATLQQKFGSYHSYWRRTLRQIENGTYVRNLHKVGRQAARTGADVPEEILAAMPKRMREQVKRDREAALALARLRNHPAEDPELLTLADEVDVDVDMDDLEGAAFIGESTDMRRNLLTATGAHRIDDADADFDVDAFFAAVTSEGEPEASQVPLTIQGPSRRPSRPPPNRAVSEPAVPVAIPVEWSAPMAVAAPVGAPVGGAVPVPIAAERSARSGPVRPDPGHVAPPPAQPAPAAPLPPPPLAGSSASRGAMATPPVPPPKVPSSVPPATPTPRAVPRVGAPPPVPGTPPSASPPPPIAAPPPAVVPPSIPRPLAPQAMKPIPVAPSQATRPVSIAPGAAAARAPVAAESMAGPFPRIPSLPPIPSAARPPSELPAIPSAPRSPSTELPTAIANDAARAVLATPPAGQRAAQVPPPARPPVPPRPPAPAPARPAPPPPPPTPPPTPSSRIPVADRRAPESREPRQAPPPGMSDADVTALYAKYVKAKQILGEEAGPGAYGKLLKTINAQAPKIMEQYKSKGVDFSVVVKDNQVIIRAKPKP